MRHILPCLLVLSACTNDDPGSYQLIGGQTGLTVDGTRLKQRYLVSDDGAQQFIGWWDSKRAEACSFHKLKGTLYCLPKFVRMSLRQNFYEDAACKQRIYSLSSEDFCNGETTSAYGLDWGTYYCGGNLNSDQTTYGDFIRLGAVQKGMNGQRLWTVDAATGSCVPHPSASLSDESRYVRGPLTVVPLSEFVTATIQNAPPDMALPSDLAARD